MMFKSLNQVSFTTTMIKLMSGGRHGARVSVSGPGVRRTGNTMGADSGPTTVADGLFDQRTDSGPMIE